MECNNCKWYEQWTGVCFNPNCDVYLEFINENFTCGVWEGLKSCPFCGADGVIREYDNKTFVASCKNCGIELLYFETEQEAIEAWNRRVGDDK